MKKLSLLCAMTLVLAVLGIPQAYGAGVDITTFDGMTSGNPSTWYNRGNDPGEHLEVEPNCVTGTQWDLQASSINTSTGALATIGTYDFVNGVDGWTSGDIFISTSGTPVYGPAVSGYNFNGNSTVANVFGYNYVLDMDWANKTYDIIALNNASTVKVYYGQNQGANPYAYASGGQVLYEDISFTVQNLAAAAILADYGVTITGASCNVVLTDISNVWSDGTLLWTHFTQKCGNDDLMGYRLGTPVPLPPSALLLGSGLLGLVGLGWRRRKS
jgi:hypothetical protein